MLGLMIKPLIYLLMKAENLSFWKMLYVVCPDQIFVLYFYGLCPRFEFTFYAIEGFY